MGSARREIVYRVGARCDLLRLARKKNNVHGREGTFEFIWRMADACIGSLLGSGCDGRLEDSTSKTPKTLFQKYLCATCKSSGGFLVNVQHVRCVPSAEAKACLPDKGGTAGGFRTSKPAIGSFRCCLCNDRYEPTRKASNIKELVYEDTFAPFGLVLLRPSFGTPEPDWQLPSPQSHPSYPISGGKLRLFFWKDEKLVAVRPKNGPFIAADQPIPVAEAEVVGPSADASGAAASASASASTSGDAYTSPPPGRGGREADVATAPMEPTPEAIQPHFSALQPFYSPSTEHPFNNALSTSKFQGIDELEHIRRLHNAAASDRKFELIWTETCGFCYRCVKTIAAGEPLFVYGGQLRYKTDFEASVDREKRERWVYALESSRVQTVIDGYPYQSSVALPTGDPYTTLFKLPSTHLGSLLDEPDSRGAATAVIGDITARQLGLPDTLPPLKIVRASNKAILPGDYITISYGQGSGHIHPHRATNPSQGA